MDATRDLYLQQKLGDTGKREYTTVIQIQEAKHLDIGKNGAISVKDEDGNYYTHFLGEDKEFAEELKAGNEVGVYVRQKPNPNNKQFPYRNITRKLF